MLCRALPAAALALLALSALGPASVRAREGGDQMSEFFDAIDVDIVDVEVFVTDRQGNPIPGLTKDDFTVLEDGEEQEITNFFAGEAVRPTVDVEGLALPLEDGEASAEFPADAPVEADQANTLPVLDQRLHLVLFIDNRNISPTSRNRVIDAVKESLFYDLDPGDSVSLVAYSGALDVRSYPTADAQSLARGLEQMATGSAVGQQRQLDKVDLIRQMNQFDLENATRQPTGGGIAGAGFGNAGGPDVGSVQSELIAYAQREFDEVRATAAALSQFVSVLSGMPRRKALVYISDGLDLRPGEAMFQAFERATREFPDLVTVHPATEARRFDTSPYFEELGRQANAGRVTFYTILASGRGATITPAERSAFFNMDAPASSLGQIWDDTLETMEYSNRRGAMDTLASATGGRATLASASFDNALAAIKQDFDSFYSLGYRSPHADDDDHRIKVRVSNSDWRVRHRETQRRRTADERMASATRSVLMLQMGENPLGVRVDFGEPQANEGKKNELLVPIIVKFPIARLTLVPGDSFHEGKVSIYVAAQGPKGDLSPIQKMPAPVRIPNDQLLTAMSQVAGYRMTLLMRPGEHRVAVTVRDELSDVSSSAFVTHAPNQAGSAAEPTAETREVGAP